MDQLLLKLVSEAPSLVALFLIVRMFLVREKDRDLFMDRLHSEHLAARAESRTAINDNTESNYAVCKAISTLTETVRQITSGR
jgi:hypothetical protein